MSISRVNVLIVLCFLASASCRNIVDELHDRFNDVSSECFDAQNVRQPSYKCSGIIMRGVRSNETNFAWSLKPNNKKVNSFSFAFLRRDHSFRYMGKKYEAGFIIYPHLKTPSHKSTQKVLCYFPVDGYTNFRVNRGCGRRYNDTTGMSRPCHLQNVTTFPQWLEHFKGINDDKMIFIMSQCGFDMSKKRRELENFSVGLQASLYLRNNTRLAFIASELRVEGWNENDAKTIPIEAFFYFIDSKNGKKEAIKYRNDFYVQSGGETIPIVGIQLPTKTNPKIHIAELKHSYGMQQNVNG